jgi:hypothetical protein
MKASLIFLTVISIVLSSCIHKTNSKSLIGNYCLNTALRKDSIIINSNHTYTHRFHALNNRTLECKGNWEFNSTTNEIKFKDFLFFTDRGYDSLPPGNWDAKVSFTQDGKTQIIYSSEDNIYFQN